MADTETDQILDGIAPDAPADTTPADAAADTVAGDGQDTAAAAEGADTTVAEGGEDTVAGDASDETAAEEVEETKPAAAFVSNDAAYQTAVTTLQTLKTKQDALDAEFDALDKEIADGTVDSFDAGPKLQILIARQTRLERQLNTASAAVTQQQQAITQQREQAMTSHWAGLGKKYADIAETPEKATEALKDIWDEEYAKAQKANPGMHPERIAGRAEAGWENRVALLRATKGTKGDPTRKAKPPGRLTPNGGTAPTSPVKESSAVIAERTLGSLANYKF